MGRLNVYVYFIFRAHICSYIASISHSDENFIIRFCFGTCVWVKAKIQRNVKNVLWRIHMNEQMNCLITVLVIITKKSIANKRSVTYTTLHVYPTILLLFFLFIIEKWRKEIQSCKELLHNINAPNIMDFVKNVLCILDHID